MTWFRIAARIRGFASALGPPLLVVGVGGGVLVPAAEAVPLTMSFAGITLIVVGIVLTLVPLVPPTEPRPVAAPVRGRWTALNSPATKVPSHGTHSWGLLAGLALGTLFGLVAAGGIRFAYGGGASIMVLAITVGAASVVGGALAVLPGEVLEAGLWATTWVFFAGVIFGVLQPNLVKLLGSGEAANTRFVVGQSLVTGLAAAFCTLRFLRVEGNRVLWYLVGGALPGLVLLGAEWLTRAGGSAVAWAGAATS